MSTKGKCPFPICGDDGSILQCIAKGHCGCVYATPYDDEQHEPVRVMDLENEYSEERDLDNRERSKDMNK